MTEATPAGRQVVVTPWPMQEPRPFRAVRIDPGNTEVVCLICGQHVYGVTAHDVVEGFKDHYRITHAAARQEVVDDTG